MNENQKESPPLKIISFGNSNYKRIAHNWARYLQSHKIENYTVYSLDKDIYDYLIKNEINTELIESNMFMDGKIFSFKKRLEFVGNLISKDFNILHSDLDAIWIKNPLELIEKSYDIVASRGTFPKDVHKKVGYTICMGWMYYQPSTIVKELFKSTVNRCGKRRRWNDQAEFNREIFDQEEKWKNLKLKILDQTIISRNKPHNENTYVAHPVSPQHIDREKFLKSKNLWILE